MLETLGLVIDLDVIVGDGEIIEENSIRKLRESMCVTALYGCIFY